MSDAKRIAEELVAKEAHAQSWAAHQEPQAVTVAKAYLALLARPEALPPTGWIITKGDRIHHYSTHDGWKLEVVTSSGPQHDEGKK